MPGGAPEHHTVEIPQRALAHRCRCQPAVQDNQRIGKIHLQARRIVIAKRRHIAIILRRQPLEHRVSCVDDEDATTRVVDGADEIAHESVTRVVIQPESMFNRDRDVHRVPHGFDTIRDQARVGHQTSSEGPLLHPLGRTPAIQVDLIVAPACAKPGTVREIRRIAATELQRHRVLLRIEIQVTRQIAMQQRAGRDHLGIDTRPGCDQPMQVAGVLVGHVDHGRDAKPPVVGGLPVATVSTHAEGTSRVRCL